MVVTSHDDVSLAIDVNDLVKECSLQPQNLADTSISYAEILGELKRAKVNLDRHRAVMALAIRTDPSAYGLSKVTESALQETLLVDPAISAMQNEVIDLEVAVAKSQGMRDAFISRSSLLRAEVELYVNSYYSTDGNTTVKKPLLVKPSSREKISSVMENKVIKRRQRRGEEKKN